MLSYLFRRGGSAPALAVRLAAPGLLLLSLGGPLAAQGAAAAPAKPAPAEPAEKPAEGAAPELAVAAALEARGPDASLHARAEAALGISLAPGLHAEGGVSLAWHAYPRGAPGEPASGDGTRSALDVLLSTRLSYAPALLPDARLTAEWRRTGSRLWDAHAAQGFGGPDLVNLCAALPVAAGLQLVGRLDNALDARHAGGELFPPGPPGRLAPAFPREMSVGVHFRAGTRRR